MQCVLENKRREQLKKRELQPPSDLEVKLRRRQERIQHVGIYLNKKKLERGGGRYIFCMIDLRATFKE